MSKALFLAGSLGFAGGILARSLFSFSWQPLLFVVLISLILFGAFVRTKRRTFIICAILLLASTLGAGRVLLVSQEIPPTLKEQLGIETALDGTVVADPDIRETNQRVIVEVSGLEKNAKVLVVAPLYPELAYGDHLRVSGVLEQPEAFDTTNGRSFRYDLFLAKDGIFVLMPRASVDVIGPAQGSDRLVNVLFDIKHAFLGGLSQALPEPHASLAGGLIAGGKQGLGSALLDAFVVSGLVHIVVLSGYNVMIVAEAVLRMFGFLPRRMAAGLAGLVIGAFVLAAGAGAASIRAGLMAGLALTARATGRTYAVIRALLFAGCVMLLLNPFLLAYDPGFQLSFIATLGLILGAPIFESRLAFIPSAFWRDLVSATLAAQISVLPLLLYQTGLFSLVSLPANLLALPLVPIAMFFSAIAGVLGLFTGPLATLLGLPAYAVLSYLIAVVEVSASLPLASVSIPAFPFSMTLLAYGILGWLVYVSRRTVFSKETSATALLS